MSKIKICGITREEDIAAVNVALPDYIGFVFAKRSKRYVTSTQAEMLRSGLSSGIQAVGVFVNESVDNIVSVFENGVIDLAQLHGDEDDVYIEELRRHSSIPIIKAFSVDSVDDISRASESLADFVLLDHGLGGTGVSFDWDFLSMDPGTSPRMTGEGLLEDGRLLTGTPFFLAGGIDLDNIDDALALKPYAIDVSSGVETNGIKDSEKIIAMIANVRTSS
jgi:phosphoribosylanthranilate isomerase